ncbi:hypothetical protein D3C87_735480 [compost metagenome]
MKTSWNEIQCIEDHLLATGDGGDRAVFSARLMLEPGLNESLQWQQATYNVVRDYGRQKLREDIAQVAQLLFSVKEHEPFRQKILHIFKK